MLLIGAREVNDPTKRASSGTPKGGVKCSSACPWYTESGMVRSTDGSTHLGTHCRMTMHPWMVDCDQFDPMNIETVEVTEEQWAVMLAAVKKKAKRQRKLYPEEHEEIHEVGCEWTRSKGRWNRTKSGEVVVKKYRKKDGDDIAC